MPTNSITFVLRDLITGAGRTGLTLTLRHKDDSFASDLGFTISAISGKPGAYKVNNIPFNRYKLWVNGTEDATFGGDNGRWLPEGEGTIILNGADWDAASKKMVNLADPTTATGALNRQTGDVRYLLASILSTLMDLASIQTIIGEKTFNNIKIAQLRQDLSAAGWKITGLVSADGDVGSSAMSKTWQEGKFLSITNAADQYIKKLVGYTQFIYSQLIFPGSVPQIVQPPTNLLHVTNKKYVQDEIQRLLTGLAPTAFQQSGNIRRVIPSGTEEVHKVYETIVGAKTDAESYAEADEVISIIVEGTGQDTAILTDYNLLPAGSLNSYVHYVAAVEGVIMKVAEDNYTGADSVLRPVFRGFMWDNINPSAETFFQDMIFNGGKFTNTDGSGIYNFVNCHFEGVVEFSDVALTFDSDCTGILFNTVTNKYLFLGGIQQGYGSGWDIVTTDGDIRGRRILGRQGNDVGSNSSIALGDGNYFHITGNTTINLMSVSNWTPGSRVTLYFESNITVNHGSSPSSPNYPFIWKTGANKSVLADQAFTFILAEGSLFWQEI